MNRAQIELRAITEKGVLIQDETSEVTSSRRKPEGGQFSYKGVELLHLDVQLRRRIMILRNDVEAQGREPGEHSSDFR